MRVTNNRDWLQKSQKEPAAELRNLRRVPEVCSELVRN